MLCESFGAVHGRSKWVLGGIPPQHESWNMTSRTHNRHSVGCSPSRALWSYGSYPCSKFGLRFSVNPRFEFYTLDYVCIKCLIDRPGAVQIETTPDQRFIINEKNHNRSWITEQWPTPPPEFRLIERHCYPKKFFKNWIKTPFFVCTKGYNPG